MSEYPQSGPHPDSDTLSAFVEGVLPEHERLACLAHFADCAACREVVYLTEEPLAQGPAPAVDNVTWWRRRRWLTPIPALSAAVATGILVLSIALYRIEKPAPNAPRATVATSAPHAANEPPTPVLPPVQEKTVEAPRMATARRALKVAPLPPDIPQPVSPQVRSGPEVSLAAPPPVAPKDAFVNGALDAQSSIAGTITDPAGGVIPGAAVTVRATSGTATSGAPSANAFTDKSGEFLVAGLPPGQYQLQVTSPGFQPATKKVEVRKDELARADSSLSVGSVAESVEVTASAAMLNAESASKAKRDSSIAALPLAGRMAAKRPATAEKDSVSLPSKLAAVATASMGKVTFAADSAGTLYRSDNAGKKWKAVKPVWQGKVVELAADPPAAGAAFRLKTDAGAYWLSRDGNHWYSAPPQQR